MVAGGDTGCLHGSWCVRRPWQTRVRSALEETLSTGPGGWHGSRLPSWSWTDMHRGDVSSIPSIQARAIIKRNRIWYHTCFARSRIAGFLFCGRFLALDQTQGIFRSARESLERVGRNRHRRCNPGRVHRLLHPQRTLSLYRVIVGMHRRDGNGQWMTAVSCSKAEVRRTCFRRSSGTRALP